MDTKAEAGQAAKERSERGVISKSCHIVTHSLNKSLSPNLGTGRQQSYSTGLPQRDWIRPQTGSPRGHHPAHQCAPPVPCGPRLPLTDQAGLAGKAGRPARY